jgi:hypothetical protein
MLSVMIQIKRWKSITVKHSSANQTILSPHGGRNQCLNKDLLENIMSVTAKPDLLSEAVVIHQDERL